MSRLTPRAAHAVSRLLSGQDLNGDSEALPDAFRRLATTYRDLPAEARDSAWQAFLAARDDRDELVKAVADADPDGPPPGTTVEETDSPEWPPLQLIGLPLVDPFPLDIFPKAVAQFVTEGADAIGCPPDFLAVPVLAVAGGTIGRSISLFLKGDYFASSTIFAGCVGPPSDGKTPALKKVTRALRMIDERLTHTYTQAIECWEKENPDA